MSATNLPLPQPLWCERHTIRRRADKTKQFASNPSMSADDLPPPSSAFLATQFLHAFNPAESTHPLIP
jgi:hypothetical protein